MKDRLILQKQMDTCVYHVAALFKSEICYILKRLGDYDSD